jgi:hypothetical protein
MQRTPTQRQRQARLFNADEDAALVAPAPIPTHPTAIVVAVSGGIDSSGVAIWARRRWPALPIILLHNHLEQFDWPQTDTIIGALAERLGNCRRVTIQAVYELNGTITPTGANGTTLRRVHIVRDGEIWYGPARDDDAAAIPALMDLTVNYPRLKRLGLSLARRPRHLRDVWPIDRGPAGNVPGSDYIRRASEPTGCADKRSLSLAVLFRAMPTFRAGARGIARINEVNRHAAQLSFVDDKPPELRERPGVECCALRPASPHPRANVCQILQHNRPPRAFGLRNNPFGETVVHIFGKAALLTGKLL